MAAPHLGPNLPSRGPSPSALHSEREPWYERPSARSTSTRLPGRDSRLTDLPLLPGPSMQTCGLCGAQETPQWRRSADMLLCNACGCKLARQQRKQQDYEVAGPIYADGPSAAPKRRRYGSNGASPPASGPSRQAEGNAAEACVAEAWPVGSLRANGATGGGTAAPTATATVTAPTAPGGSATSGSGQQGGGEGGLSGTGKSFGGAASSLRGSQPSSSGGGGGGSPTSSGGNSGRAVPPNAPPLPGLLLAPAALPGQPLGLAPAQAALPPGLHPLLAAVPLTRVPKMIDNIVELLQRSLGQQQHQQQQRGSVPAGSSSQPASGAVLAPQTASSCGGKQVGGEVAGNAWPVAESGARRRAMRQAAAPPASFNRATWLDHTCSPLCAGQPGTPCGGSCRRRGAASYAGLERCAGCCGCERRWGADGGRDWGRGRARTQWRASGASTHVRLGCDGSTRGLHARSRGSGGRLAGAAVPCRGLSHLGRVSSGDAVSGGRHNLPRNPHCTGDGPANAHGNEHHRCTGWEAGELTLPARSGCALHLHKWGAL